MIVSTEGPLDAKVLLVGEAPGCFTEDVDVLTTEGWCPISSCDTTTLVAQYDEGKIEFVNPLKIIEEQYTGPIITLSGALNLSVTPNHRFLIYNKYHKKFLVEEADKLRLRYSEQSVILSGLKEDGIQISDNLIKLIVAVQADGSYDETGIRFEFQKERKVIRLLMILNELGATYRIGERNCRDTFRLTLPKKDPIYWFIEKMIPDKRFTWKLLAFNKHSLQVLLDELQYWDGSKDTRNSTWTYFEYCSSIQQNIDIVQAIAHLCNCKAHCAEHAGSIRAIISEKSRAQVTALNSVQGTYSGTVYCLTVPSGFFVVRVNGVVFITGNSEEDKTGKPFVGPAGRTLDSLLSQAGISRYQCLVTNVAREQPPANKISFYFEDKKCTLPKAILRRWIQELKEEIELYQPNIIVALGSTALWALTGEKKISDFRGYITPCTLVPGRKVLPTYHPQAVNYEYKLHFPTVLDLRKALRHSSTPEFPEIKQTFLPNVDVKRFIAYMEECISHPEWEYLSIDVETLQPGSHIEELGLSHDPNFGISVFLLKGRTNCLCENDELLLWRTFTRLIACKKIVMQNGSYDIGVLWHNQHILVENLWMDTLLAAHICWPELPRDLGFLGSICLEVPPWKNSSKTDIYNPADAANTLGIALVLDKEINKQGLRKIFNFEMGLIPVSLMMQLQGIEVDRDKQKELIDSWTKKRNDLENQLDTVIGRKINFNSPKQMQQLLYMDLKLPVQYKRRKSVEETRTMTTDADALRTLSRLVPNNPVFNLILDFKKAQTLINSFLSIELSPEGKVHTSYNITGASSDDEEDTKKTKRSFGRWSSSASIILPYGSGNLQNIPTEARKMYRSRPGWKIIEADYVQAEAVVVSHLANNMKMLKMFKDAFGLSPTERKPYDIHVLKATELFGVEWELVTPEMRRVGKTVRHARNYKAGPLVLANRLGVPMSAAKKLIALDERADPSLGMWHLNVEAELKRTRTLYNLLGRKHRFLDRWGDSLFRSAYSFVPQGTVGDLLNTAIKKVYDLHIELPFEMIILLQLHDAMYVMVKEENVMESIRFLRKCMLIPITYNNEEFMIDIDFKIKDSWAEGEEVEINWRNENGI